MIMCSSTKIFAAFAACRRRGPCSVIKMRKFQSQHMFLLAYTCIATSTSSTLSTRYTLCNLNYFLPFNFPFFHRFLIINLISRFHDSIVLIKIFYLFLQENKITFDNTQNYQRQISFCQLISHTTTKVCNPLNFMPQELSR